MVTASEPAAPLSPGLQGLGYTVSHQKLELEIDFATKSLKGKTDITIQPTQADLKGVRLNCRLNKVTRQTINGHATIIKYQDPFANLSLPEGTTVHQHHQLRQKIAGSFKDPADGEFWAILPKGVHIEEANPTPTDTQNASAAKVVPGEAKRGSEDAGASLPTAVSKSAEEPIVRYTPITLSIEFETQEFRDGLQFIGCEEGDQRYPHAYTRVLPAPGSACSIFPCIDDASARCTWDIVIKYPRTLADIFPPQTPGSASDADDATPTSPANPAGSIDDEASDASSDEEDDVVEARPAGDGGMEMSVVCSGELVEEAIDPSNPARKVSTFALTNVVSAQHIGFAVGPFEIVDLSEFRETNDNGVLGQSAVKVLGYCLPGRELALMNTCFPTAAAIDYFTVTYGSYPFSSYAVCFVDDLSADITKIASCTICSSRLLYPEEVLDPIDSVPRQLTEALASQWAGIFIVPREPADTWITVGISHFITDTFLRKLCGNNDFRFRQKLAADKVCELDVGRPSLSALGAIIHLDRSQLEFMELKAPLVLFTLDRRLIKASGSAGITRAISRLFLNAKIGDAAVSCIGTTQFQRMCEKFGHVKLDTFFQEWVYGAGCPRFVVTQRFNKKKLVIEMLVKQVQADQNAAKDLSPDTFIRDVREEALKIEKPPVRPLFTGSMTIRIHEADGTPYDYLAVIKEATVKLEIPYNTKYKRLKRNRRQNERAAAAAGIDPAVEGGEEALLYCFGDVLQSEEEMRDWRLSELGKEEEDRMNQESYEWIRMDADFEWICQLSISMPWYMFLSQMQQDRDVIAQYDSVLHLSKHEQNALTSTHLVRVLMDERYFHGIRTAAAHALAKCAKEELDWIGLFHLHKAFRELYCHPGSSLPRANDFSDRRTYYVQAAIPQAMAEVRDNNGRVPRWVQVFLVDLLKYNDNTDNEFEDYHYVSTLMHALCSALIGSGNAHGASSSERFTDAAGAEALGVEEEKEESILPMALEEIERYGRRDDWSASYLNIYSRASLDCMKRLVKAGLAKFDAAAFFQLTVPGNYDPLRLTAFRCLVELGMLRHNLFFKKHMLTAIANDRSPYVRDELRRLLVWNLAKIAIGADGDDKLSGGQAALHGQPADGLIIEQEPTSEAARQAHLARKQTVVGALAALKAEMGDDEEFKKFLWETVRSPYLGMAELGELLEICNLLYEPQTSHLVVFRLPRYWKAQHIGKGVVRFTQNGDYQWKPKGPMPSALKLDSDIKLWAAGANSAPSTGTTASSGGSSGSSGSPRSTFAIPRTPASPAKMRREAAAAAARNRKQDAAATTAVSSSASTATNITTSASSITPTATGTPTTGGPKSGKPKITFTSKRPHPDSARAAGGGVGGGGDAKAAATTPTASSSSLSPPTRATTNKRKGPPPPPPTPSPRRGMSIMKAASSYASYPTTPAQDDAAATHDYGKNSNDNDDDGDDDEDDGGNGDDSAVAATSRGKVGAGRAGASKASKATTTATTTKAATKASKTATKAAAKAPSKAAPKASKAIKVPKATKAGKTSKAGKAKKPTAKASAAAKKGRQGDADDGGADGKEEEEEEEEEEGGDGDEDDEEEEEKEKRGKDDDDDAGAGAGDGGDDDGPGEPEPKRPRLKLRIKGHH